MKFKQNLLFTGLIAFTILLAAGYLLLRFLPYPELESFLKTPYSLKIADDKGNLIHVLPLTDGSRREFIPDKEIPDFLKKIFIRSEDKRFYLHFGVDLPAIIRSCFLNLRYRRNVSGASTITMQLARIISNRPKGLPGKIVEAFHAMQLEARFSKKQIFGFWINAIPYGYRSAGIRTAAKTFFNKEITGLSPGEALALAVIPRSPERYNPFTGLPALRKKAWELSRRIGFKISYEEIEKDLTVQSAYQWTNLAPHFINFIKSQISLDEQTKGLELKTALNLSYNLTLQERIRFYLDKYGYSRVSNGALFAIDNRTGEIIIYLGSNDFNDTENSGQIDGIQITNQPGSTLKPFLYGLALDQGFTPATVLPDIPQDFGDENLYFPLNFNRRFHGPVRLRLALASSLNVPAVYIVTRLGVQNFVDRLLELEFDSLNSQRSILGSGIALGNAEISLYELVRAFSVFPRRGQQNELTFKHETDKSFKPGRQIYSEYAAAMICSILSDNKSRLLGFAPNNSLNTDFPAIFKTGTSNQFNNVWALGATPDYTAGVWIGNFSGETVIGQTGNSLPVYLCIEALTLLKNNEPYREFDLPEDCEKIEICPLSGEKATANCPDRITEYFKKNQVPADCSYHIKEGDKVIVNYPALYSGYFARRPQDNITFSDDTQAFPRILKPNNNAVFYYAPDIPPENQAVRIEILHNDPDETLDLFINGRAAKKLTYPYLYYFPLRKGVFEIEIRGKNNRDQINVTVK